MSEQQRDEHGPAAFTLPIDDLRAVNEYLLLAGLREQALGEEARQLVAVLNQRLLRDPLTDLPNRVLFVERLELLLRGATHPHTTFAVLFLDLDRFKAINDTLGHAAGDLLLQQVAARLRETLRDADTVARLHGDEFAILLPGDGAAAAAKVIRKVRRALALPFLLRGSSMLVGVSIGCANYPLHGMDAATLLARADATMYAMKRRHSKTSGGAGALESSEARFRALVQRATDVVTVIDANGRIAYQSPAAEHVLGATPAALLGHSVFALIHRANRSRVRAALAQLLADPSRVVVETLRVRHRDGGWRVVEVTGTNLLAEPAVCGIVTNLRDVTAREVAAMALRHSEASLAEVQRIAHVGSWEYDYATGALHLSDELFRITGHAPHGFVPTGAAMLALVHPADRARMALAPLDGPGVPALAETDFRCMRPDGTVRILHQYAENRYDAAGRLSLRIGTVQDVTKWRALEGRLAHQATHDALTDLPNRALLLARLGGALIRAAGTGRLCAVLCLDLDHFKHVNDSLGHAAGDRLLVAVAARLGAVLDDGDTLARLGGDEFVVLLGAVADGAEAARVAVRLHAALEQAFTVDGQEIMATTGVGLALGIDTVGTADAAENLLRFADVALYRAKATGRARTVTFAPAMGSEPMARLGLERDLRRALAREELVLYYQPKVDLGTGRVTVLEALVRWRHPTRGLVPPGDFIPLAEESGLIVPLGRWALRVACRQVVAWTTAYPGQPGPRLAVNLSAREFRDPDLVASVAATLAATGLAPDRLILEVTETAAMEQVEAAIQTLTALRVLGTRLALDDFGTGHASLAYLQRLPLDTLKLDRAFFADTPQNRAIVGAVTTLAHGLGLDVTAEGLETAGQVAWARAAGCERGQGYYFSRPLPADELATFWAGDRTFSFSGDRGPDPPPAALVVAA